MSALTSVYKYQYDDTGVSPTNLITNEERTFSAADPTVFILNEGLFFSESVVITDGSNELTEGIDYEFVVLDAHFTYATGKGVYAGIKRLSSALLGTCYVTYQCLGGPEGQANSFVMSLKEAIEAAIANPNISWSDIQNPPTLFEPSRHRHYPSDLEDLDLLSQKFDDFVEAIVSVRFYKDSNYSLRNDIMRLTALSGSLRNSINAIAAISGTANDIINIQNRLNAISEEVRARLNNLPAQSTTEIYSRRLSEFDAISLIIILKSDDLTHSFKVNVVKLDEKISVSYSDFISTEDESRNSEIVSLGSGDLLMSDTGADFKINITPKVATNVVIKELYVV